MSAFTVEHLGSGGKELVTLFGVKYVATRWAWVNVALTLVCGVAVARVFHGELPLPRQLLAGLAFAILIQLGMACHGLGHVLSSRLVGAPMQSLVMTATVSVARYEDRGPLPRRVHIGRALGGPALNLALAAAALTVWSVEGGAFVAFFGVLNALLGVVTVLPIPSLDGAVIWLGAGGSRDSLREP